MARIWFRSSIDELEQLALAHRAEPAVLGQLWDELTYRDTERAKLLKREIEGLLDGSIPKVTVPVGSMDVNPGSEVNSRNEPEPEGLDDSDADGWGGDYPLDAVFVRREARTVNEVVRRIGSGRYVLDPDFQRDFVWSAGKQSKLIESCVMRIPLPVFYVAEGPDGRIIVVDGLQRLTTFQRFLNDDLKLQGLGPSEAGKPAHPLEGKRFSELPISLQERVLDTQLTMYILDAKAPERARLDIFERVNSGEPLTRQQMRNALYNGPGTTWLRDAANSNAFRSATGASLSVKTMRDREAINRFCAFELLGWQAYRTGDMDGFLADGLTCLAKLSEADRGDLRRRLDGALELNREMFEEHAFRKSLADERRYAPRTVINISLFEVCVAAMSRDAVLDRQQEIKARLKNAVIALVRDPFFSRAITYSTNSTLAVHTRFGLMHKALNEVVRR